MAGEPILVPCEGSGCPTHYADSTSGICAMCGRRGPVDDEGLAKPHQRDDILARFKRGDFDRG